MYGRSPNRSTALSSSAGKVVTSSAASHRTVGGYDASHAKGRWPIRPRP